MDDKVKRGRQFSTADQELRQKLLFEVLLDIKGLLQRQIDLLEAKEDLDLDVEVDDFEGKDFPVD